MSHKSALAGHALPRMLAALAACALALFLAVPGAMASEGVTRQLAGVSFTVPADWEEVDLGEAAQALEDEGVEAVAYGREDGLFLGAVIRDSDLEVGEVSDEELAAAAAYIEAELAGTPLEGVTIRGDVEQGLPAFTASTSDIALNGVAYSLTAKLFLGAGAAGDEGVLMVAVLPASGQVTEGFEDTVAPLDEAAAIDAGGIAYEVPAGFRLVQVDALGFSLDCASDEEGDRGLIALSAPVLADELGEVTAADLKELAEEVYSEVSGDSELSGALEAFWCDAYDFLGFPTLGAEGVYADEAAGDVYFCLTLSVTGEGLSALVAVQPAGDGFAEALLGGASAAAAPAAGQAEPGQQGGDAGFVVGMAAA